MTKPLAITEVFRTEAGTYMRIVLGRWLRQNYWWLVVPTLLCLALAITVSAAFVFVALIVVFLLYPMSMMIVYFNYALSPEACAEVSAHRVEFTTDGLIIDYMSRPDVENERTEYEIVKSVEIPYHQVCSYVNTDTSLILFTDRHGYRLHYIPASSMTQECHEIARTMIERSCV